MKTVRKVQIICDGGCIKHGSDFSCVCDAGHTVQFNQPFVMRRNTINGQPDEGVCDTQHIVDSNELFVIRQHKRNGQPDQGVCVISGKQVCNQKCVGGPITTQTIPVNKPCVL